MTSQWRESFEEDEFSSEEDTLNGRTQSGFSFEEELNSIAKRSNGFGPKIVHEKSYLLLVHLLIHLRKRL